MILGTGSQEKIQDYLAAITGPIFLLKKRSKYISDDIIIIIILQIFINDSPCIYIIKTFISCRK